MRQLSPEDREPPLRIWRRGLHLSPPQLRFTEQRAASGGLLASLAAFWSRLLRRG